MTYILAGNRWLLGGWLIYGLLWIGLEGHLWRVGVFGVWSALILVMAAWQRWGKEQWLATVPVRAVVFGVLGGLVGVTAVALTLFLMVLKTGLHGHGPEFSPYEIHWVGQQWFVWGLAGGLAGVGFGLIQISYGGEKE